MTTPTHLLNARATVMAQTWVSDGRGGRTETFVARTAVPVPVMVSQPRAVDRTAAGSVGADVDGFLYFTPAAVVEIGDRVHVEGDDEGHWRVDSVVTDSRTTLKRAECARRQAEDGD